MRWTAALIAHAVATGVLAVVTFVVVAVGYVGLLLWAVLAGEPLGGPFALLASLLTAAALVPVMVLLFLMPATALARGLRRALTWPWWSEVPLAAGALAALVALAFFVLHLLEHAELSAESAEVAAAVAATMLLPLGLYWWCFTAADGVVRVVRSIGARIAAAIRARSGAAA
jgi:hypothetical protein